MLDFAFVNRIPNLLHRFNGILVADDPRVITAGSVLEIGWHDHTSPDMFVKASLWETCICKLGHFASRIFKFRDLCRLRCARLNLDNRLP